MQFFIKKYWKSIALVLCAGAFAIHYYLLHVKIDNLQDSIVGLKSELAVKETQIVGFKASIKNQNTAIEELEAAKVAAEYRAISLAGELANVQTETNTEVVVIATETIKNESCGASMEWLVEMGQKL